MGKTSRWLRALLGFKKSSDLSPASEQSRPTKGKKKWGFARSFNSKDRDSGGSYAEASSSGPCVEGIDANKHAIAVAAATAAVAEAALAAAQAAAEVVRLTSRTPATAYVSGSGWRREWATVKIQSAFRAYLARRALRALKGLVRLQALVRGHIVRKQSADMLRRMQAMARIQARASENRAHVSEPSHSNQSSQSCNSGHATSKKCNNQLRAYSVKPEQSSILKGSQSNSKIKDSVGPEREPKERAPLGSNWLDQWMEECSWNSASLKTAHADDARSDKILEVDTWKPHLNSMQGDRIFRTSRHFNHLSKHSTKFQKQNLSVPSGEVSSLRSLKSPAEVNQAAVWTSENSPRVQSASSRPGSSGRKDPFSPARSECSRSVFSNYLGYPNYMSNTESSLAKVRSHSAPRQRMQVEKLGSTNRFVHGFWDVDTISERGSAASDANFGAKAYSGSCHLYQFGMPIQGSNSAGYSSSYHRRY